MQALRNDRFKIVRHEVMARRSIVQQLLEIEFTCPKILKKKLKHVKITLFLKHISFFYSAFCQNTTNCGDLNHLRSASYKPNNYAFYLTKIIPEL